MRLLKGGEVRQPKSWGNGYFRFSLMDLVKLLSVFAWALGLYYGIRQEIATHRTETLRVIALQTQAIRHLAYADSVGFAMRDQQARYNWDESMEEHDALWKAIHRPSPPRKEYLAPWRRAPDAWQRGEAVQ